MIKEVNEENFGQEVLKQKGLVLVDFWAPWCGPCKMIASTIEEIAQQYLDKLRVTKVNVEEAPTLASQYAVMSIPTLMLFKDGQVLERKVGSLSKRELEKFLLSYL